MPIFLVHHVAYQPVGSVIPSASLLFVVTAESSGALKTNLEYEQIHLIISIC
jgi:hypothetical protein